MHSEYQEGDTLSFTERGQTLSGQLVGVTPPGVTASGLPHPTEYWVDDGTGFPKVVYAHQLVEREEHAL